MKKLTKYISIFFGVLTLFTSCWFFDNDPGFDAGTSYGIALSFQDSLGNDLVKGIELIGDDTESGKVNKDLYILDIFPSEGCNDFISSKDRNYFNKPELIMNTFNETCFLNNTYGISESDCTDEKVITYKLRCSFIFGDYEYHEIVSYWNVPEINDYVSYAECVRIEFEGKTFYPMTSPEGYMYKVIITLENDNL